MSINHTLLSLLNRIFPPEQPTETELLSYVRETSPVEKRVVYLLEHICPTHGTPLQEIAPGQWKCTTPHVSPSQSRQDEAQVPSTYTTYTQDIQPRYAQFHALERHETHMAQVKIAALHSDAPLTAMLASVPKGVAFHQPRLQPLEVEEASWLNSQPVTPEEVPIVDLEATMSVPAIMQLKHGA